MTALCVRCERPTADGYACVHCGVTKASEQLATIADMAPAARDVAHGQARRGPGGGGSEPRLPINTGATQRLDDVQRELRRLGLRVAVERGIRGPGTDGDPIVRFARWLTQHLEWYRHHNTADDFLETIWRCERIVAGIARGPAEQRYLGPCGAKCCDLHNRHCEPPSELCCADCTEAAHPEHPPGVRCTWLRSGDDAACEGDVYARVGASTGRCRTCEAEVSTSERQAWLDGEVRGHTFRASQIAGAYGVNVNTIRSWAARGQLVAHGHDPDGRPLYNVGDVLDLAAADAARRAGEQAKRARRAAAREAAETEGDAA